MDCGARSACRPVRDRLRQRRLLDLLRARPGRGARARAHAARSSCSPGGLFALTAKDLRRGRVDVPEAGGSSSFARHAFNDWISFFAGWALSLDYILTIAISAYFVPFYAARCPDCTRSTGPLESSFALGVLVLLVFLNIRGLGESRR